MKSQVRERERVREGEGFAEVQQREKRLLFLSIFFFQKHRHAVPYRRVSLDPVGETYTSIPVVKSIFGLVL